MLNTLPFPWEPGCAAADLRRDASKANKTTGFDTVFRGGLMLRKLPDTLSSGQRGGYAGTAAELESVVLAAIRDGDVIKVKGPFGSHMETIVNALEPKPRAAM